MTVKIQNDTKDKINLLKEAATITQFDHKNIVHLHGIVTDDEQV